MYIVMALSYQEILVMFTDFFQKWKQEFMDFFWFNILQGLNDSTYINYFLCMFYESLLFFLLCVPFVFFLDWVKIVIFDILT